MGALRRVVFAGLVSWCVGCKGSPAGQTGAGGSGVGTMGATSTSGSDGSSAGGGSAPGGTGGMSMGGAGGLTHDAGSHDAGKPGSGTAGGTGGHASVGGMDAGQVDSGSHDAGHAADSGTRSPTSCPGATCKATEVCIAYRTVGGAIFFPDAGMCAAGRHVEQVSTPLTLCNNDFAYKCVPLQGCSGSAVSCACANDGTHSTCNGSYFACSDPQAGVPWLSASAQLVCEQQVP